jgi:hypothetical protein
MQDAVTNFWYSALHRGFIVHPDENPLHPANLCSPFNETSDDLAVALRETIAAIDNTGYDPVEDYEYKDNKILQKPDRMWCRVLLERTIYECYRRWHVQFRSSDIAAQPEGETRFWAKTGNIFPSFHKAKTNLNAMCTKFVVPHGAFQMTQFRGKNYMDELKDVAARTKTRFANEHHSFVLLPCLPNMRTAFINGTGRSDVTFPDDVNELFAMNTTRKQLFARSEYYFNPTTMLKHFGFKEEELTGLYTDMKQNGYPEITRCLDMFEKLCKVEEDVGDDLEAKVNSAMVILPKIKDKVRSSKNLTKSQPATLPPDQNSIKAFTISSSTSSSTSNIPIEKPFPF